MIPARAHGESFEAHQRSMAQWMGVSVETMNAHHDALHRALCAWLGVESMAMVDAAGGFLSSRERELAALEEQAVCHLQRFIHAANGKMPHA